MKNKVAYVNLFEFSMGIGIQIGDERYNLVNCNSEGILQMIENYDIEEVVLVGPKIITSKYEKELMELSMTQFNKNYKIKSMEG